MDEATAPLATDHLPPGTELLDLAAERAVTFRAGGGYRYTYRGPRLTAADWDRYFSGIEVSSENRGKKVVDVINVSSSGAEMVRHWVARVEGYAGDLISDPEWKKYLPPGHLNVVFAALCQVAVRPRTGPLDPRRVEVELDADWFHPQTLARMRTSGLIHRFAPPSAEHLRRYDNATTQTILERGTVGGVKGGGGKTIYPPRQRILIGFYDELVQSVEGYGLAGQPLASAEQVRREMDDFHKVIAVNPLFAPSDLDDPAAEEQEAA